MWPVNALRLEWCYDTGSDKNITIIRLSMQQGWGQVQLTKYSSTPSTPNIYHVQVLVKYSFFKKYLSTSSTFISSTSTHSKICSKVRSCQDGHTEQSKF